MRSKPFFQTIFLAAGLAIGQLSQAGAIESVIAWDFNAYHAGTTTGSPPPPRNGTALLTILDMYPRLDANAARGIISKTLSPNGYTSSEVKKTDRCKGEYVIGESTPYLSEVVLEKRADTFMERVWFDQDAPYGKNPVILSMRRGIRYASKETAAEAEGFVAELLKRYGTPAQSISTNGSKYPTSVIWNAMGSDQSLSVQIEYYRDSPDKISSVEFYSSIPKGSYDALKNETRSLCYETKRLDDARKAEIERNKPAGAPKF